MKRFRQDGLCAHISTELSAVDFGNILLRHSSWRETGQDAGLPVGAPYVCCGCAQLVCKDGPGAGMDTGCLRGCACGATLLLDIARSELYCCACRDYVYLNAFDEGRQLSHVVKRYVDRGLSPGLPPHDPGPDVRAKRARAAHDPALVPLRREAAELVARRSAGPKRSPSDEEVLPPTRAPADLISSDGFPAGLRGLNNLGNTCFMNSVLQVFIHSPLMRNYFLGQGHTQATCAKKDKQAAGASTPCLSCELDAVFAAAYSGERAPLSPTDFLYSWWTFADSLAGYQQQDAHEFYLSALSGLAAAVILQPPLPPIAAAATHSARGRAGDTSPQRAGTAIAVKEECGAGGRIAGMASDPSPRTGQHADGLAGEAGCVAGAVSEGGPGPSTSPDQHGRPAPGLSLVDTVFGGVLRSDVTCSVCGHTSTAYDPFLDISLDVVAFGMAPPQPGPGPPSLAATITAGTAALATPPQDASGTPPTTSLTLTLALASTEPSPDADPDPDPGSGGDGDGADASRRRQALALQPSASACGGQSSLSVSLPPCSPPLSGSLTSSSQSQSAGASGECTPRNGKRRRAGEAEAETEEGALRGSLQEAEEPEVAGSDSEDSCGPLRADGEDSEYGNGEPGMPETRVRIATGSAGAAGAAAGSPTGSLPAGSRAMAMAMNGQRVAQRAGHAAPVSTAAEAGQAAWRAPTPCTADAPGPALPDLQLADPGISAAAEPVGQTVATAGRPAAGRQRTSTGGGGSARRRFKSGDKLGGPSGLDVEGAGVGQEQEQQQQQQHHPGHERADGELASAAMIAPSAVHQPGGLAAGARDGKRPVMANVRTSSDSVAAAESAAEGGHEVHDGGGRGGPPAGPSSVAAPEECVTSPRAAPSGLASSRGLEKGTGPRRPQGWEPLSMALQDDMDMDGGGAAGPGGSCAATPGASASCAIVVNDDDEVEGDGEATEGGVGIGTGACAVTPDPPSAVGEEADLADANHPGYGLTAGEGVTEPLLGDPSCADDGPGSAGAGVVITAPGRGLGGRRGSGPGRVPRGRGRGGGRGRRGGGRVGLSGAAAAAAAAKRERAVPQMGQPGAAGADMVDPRLARRPGGGSGAEGSAPLQAATAAASASHATLHGCLRHFVTPEKLSASEAWVCSACQLRQPAVKQLSIRRLPPVLALHVKRFEQRGHHSHHQQSPHYHNYHQGLHANRLAQHARDKTLHVQHPQSGELPLQQDAAEGGQATRQGPSRDMSAALGGAVTVGPLGVGGLGGGAYPPAGSSYRRHHHAARKLQTQLHFPLSLDLTPYTTPSILHERYAARPHPVAVGTFDAPAAPLSSSSSPPPASGEGAAASDPTAPSTAAPTCPSLKPDPGDGGGGSGDTLGTAGAIAGDSTDGGSADRMSLPGCQYRLFAVISHKGDLSGGHYVVFVRPGGGPGSGWYQCDDAWVTAVSEEDVTACQAYMLFYSSVGAGSGAVGVVAKKAE